MNLLRQATVITVRFGPFLDSTDGVTPETGLTIAQADMQLSKGGTAFAQKNAAGNATHDVDGWYSTSFNTTDTGSLRALILQVTVAGALPVWVNYFVVEEASFDALVTDGLFNFDAATNTVANVTATASVSGAVGSVTGNVGGNVAGSVNSVTTDVGITQAGADKAWSTAVREVTSAAKITADGSAITMTSAGVIATVTTTTINTDMRGTESALLASSAPTNFGSMVISGAGAVDSLLNGFLNTPITETSAGRIANNFDFFYDNANAQTTQVVDDVGTDTLLPSAGWLWSTATSGVPISGRIRGNNATIASITELSIHQETADGKNAGLIISALRDGDKVGVFFDANPDVFLIFDVTATPILTGSVYAVTGTVDSTAGTFVNTVVTVGYLVTGNADLVDDIWDEVLTGASHNVNNSSGKRLRQVAAVIFAEGTAQSGGDNSIQLAAGDVTIDDQFRRAKIILVGGTGEGQEAIITSSVASTDTLTTTPAWLVDPDNTTEYEVLPGQAHTTVRNGGYEGGRVFVDTVNGNSGTEIGVNGTSTNPSDNMTDAYIIAGNEMITGFNILPGSTITLPADSTTRQFNGAKYNILLNGADIDGSTFNNASSVTGVATAGSGNSPSFFVCGMGSVTLPPSNGLQCGLFGTITIGSAGSFTFGECASVFDSTPIIDYGSGLNASSFFLQSWGGGSVEIQNAGAGTGTYKFEMSAVGGDLTINANCSATTEVEVHGSVQLTNNASGITINNFSNSTGAALETAQDDLDIITGTDGATLAALQPNEDFGAITKNAAFSNFEFLMVLASDNVTPGTGLTVSGQRSINGGAFASVAGTIAEVSNGIYQFDALAADTNGDVITWRFIAATADDTFVTFKTVS